jgi:maltose O-acetyltransferase
MGVKVGRNVKVMNIRVEGVTLDIGDDTFIGSNTTITGGPSKVHIGKNCDISSNVSIVTGTHEIGSKYRAAGKETSKDIYIGDGVWIGYGSLILPGVKIGDGTIIAAGSVINRNIPDYVLAAGCPAQIKRRIFD